MISKIDSCSQLCVGKVNTANYLALKKDPLSVSFVLGPKFFSNFCLNPAQQDGLLYEPHKYPPSWLTMIITT